MKVYANKLFLPSERAEIEYIKNEKRTCFNTFYPFKIFPDKKLNEVEFGGITLLYGGNGSGKSTLINITAQLMNAIRYTEFNRAPLFDTFLDMCYVEYNTLPKRSYVLTSDDVFDYVLHTRLVNEKIDDRRNELFDKYVSVKREVRFNPELGRLNGLDDYERWKETREIISRKNSQSSFVKKRVGPNVELHSNGETAMRYFIERIDEDAVYFLDEPENSLSIEFQIDLLDYIESTARVTDTQFIIATHSPIFLSLKGAKVYNLDAYPAGVCNWTELPNVRKYFEFFMDRRDEFVL